MCCWRRCDKDPELAALEASRNDEAQNMDAKEPKRGARVLFPEISPPPPPPKKALSLCRLEALLVRRWKSGGALLPDRGGMTSFIFEELSGSGFEDGSCWRALGGTELCSPVHVSAMIHTARLTEWSCEG